MRGERRREGKGKGKEVKRCGAASSLGVRVGPAPQWVPRLRLRRGKRGLGFAVFIAFATFATCHVPNCLKEWIITLIHRSIPDAIRSGKSITDLT
jgi:hypothetical protein